MVELSVFIRPVLHMGMQGLTLINSLSMLAPLLVVLFLN
jgi:hypothetical protein